MLVSYRQLEDKLKGSRPNLKHAGLFINHTLWNRDANRVYFFARAGWSGGNKDDRINQPFSIHIDGTGLTEHERHIGGHPEWAEGSVMIGREGDKQIFYNVDTKKIVGQMGTIEMFPKPEGDISLSPDGNWFVNGYKLENKSTDNYFAVYRRSDGAFARSEGVAKGPYSEVRELRIDPAPRWNRTNDAILVPGFAKNKTRQMFLITVSIAGE